MSPRSESSRDIAKYLIRNDATRVIGVLRVLHQHNEGFRGKVNLGFAAGVRGRNGYATRPVATAVRLGLAREDFEHGAYRYILSPRGLAVINLIDGRT